MTAQERDEEEFPFAAGEVFDAALEAAASIKRFRLETPDKGSGRIRGTAGNIWITTVQKIEILISVLSPGRTLLSVTSASWPSTVILDHGKNRENVDHILDTVWDILERKFPEQFSLQPGPGVDVSEFRIREQLKPLEQLLSKGTITPAEFEATRNRILREASGIRG